MEITQWPVDDRRGTRIYRRCVLTGIPQTRCTHQQQHAADNTPTDGCTTCAELMAHRDTLLAELASMDATLAEVETTIEKEVEETRRRLAPPAPYAGSACSA